MEKKSDDFKDYVHEGMDRFIALASRTGRALDNLTQDTIVKIDILQLKKKKDALLQNLGFLCYSSIIESKVIDSSLPKVSVLIKEITLIQAEIEKRESAKKYSNKNDEK